MIITIGLLTRRGNKDTKVGEAGSWVLDLEEVGGRKRSKYKKKYSRLIRVSTGTLQYKTLISYKGREGI